MKQEKPTKILTQYELELACYFARIFYKNPHLLTLPQEQLRPIITPSKLKIISMEEKCELVFALQKSIRIYGLLFQRGNTIYALDLELLQKNLNATLETEYTALRTAFPIFFSKSLGINIPPQIEKFLCFGLKDSKTPGFIIFENESISFSQRKVSDALTEEDDEPNTPKIPERLLTPPQTPSPINKKLMSVDEWLMLHPDRTPPANQQGLRRGAITPIVDPSPWILKTPETRQRSETLEITPTNLRKDSEVVTLNDDKDPDTAINPQSPSVEMPSLFPELEEAANYTSDSSMEPSTPEAPIQIHEQQLDLGMRRPQKPRSRAIPTDALLSGIFSKRKARREYRYNLRSTQQRPYLPTIKTRA